ncbi:hypothetical protein NPX13_g8522 [Xylaria arbuscula]|uniref:N-acetyltransferase domain-containing protein n=1 Tax=Xylaria arbuscula TaxID=114810 RepID=A0A9W8N8S4_9PEZI|nr:hypothetical protein NPX13_g8522 [Xylaria arbuscula]
MHYGFGLASDEFFHLGKNVPVNEGGVHSYDSVANLEIDDAQRFSRFMMYNNGRVAWFPEGYSMPFFAVVDDLRTRTRRGYLFPDHGETIRGYKTAMGKKLFVMGHDTKLHVWHLELNRLETIEVPENFKRCITEGETLLIVSQNSDLYLWKFGGSLQPIDRPPQVQQLLKIGTVNKLSVYPREYVASGGPPVWTPRIWLSNSQHSLHLRNSQMLIDFILFPNLSGVFFVITLALDESGKLTVYEIHNGEIAATYVMEDRIYTDPRTSERGLLRWEKLNSFGGYCLVQVIQEPLSRVGDADGEACPCGRKSRQLVSMCFNIYTKAFTVLRHHLNELSPWISHVWNDRLYIMDDQFHRRQATQSRRPVMSIAPCTERDVPLERAASIHVYTTMNENASLVYRRRRVSYDPGDMGEKLNIELGLDVLQEFSPRPTWKESFIPYPSEMNPGKLVGDDEFFIFINTPSYTLLNFGDGFPTKQPFAQENKREPSIFLRSPTLALKLIMSTIKPFNPFRSDRLVYRAVNDTPEDDDFVHAIQRDAEAQSGSSYGLLRPETMSDSKRFKEHIAKSLLGVIICLPPANDTEIAGEPVGILCLKSNPPAWAHHRWTDISIDVLKKHQGKGYGGEAIRWSLWWSFQMAGLHRVQIQAFSFNAGAMRLYQRLGFKEEGRIRDHLFFAGGWHDNMIYGILEDEWRDGQRQAGRDLTSCA